MTRDEELKLFRILDELNAINHRYRLALEFYADENEDQGLEARAALGITVREPIPEDQL